MTPEELEEAKHYATHYQDGYVKDLILNLLDHIEQQASRNTKLETALIDCRAEYLLFLDENPNAFAWDFDELSREAQDRYRNTDKCDIDRAMCYGVCDAVFIRR